MAAVPLDPGIVCTDMLRQVLPKEADLYPQPAEWARAAAAFLLALGPADNGRPLSLKA